jgi:hypothetical protein
MATYQIGQLRKGRQHGDKVMKCGDRVRVKKLANVEKEFRGKTGTLIEDSTPGHVILVGLDDELETKAHQFLAEDLEQINLTPLETA